jgi:hypothetical protein
MLKTKTQPAKSKASKIVRSPNALAARVTALETRMAQWGPDLDAQFAELARRIEMLEKGTQASGSRDHQGDSGIGPARVYALERRVAELEAAVKLQE